jgi:hypothetical protein
VQRVGLDREDEGFLIGAVDDPRLDAPFAAQPGGLDPVHAVDNASAVLLHKNRRQLGRTGRIGEQPDVGGVNPARAQVEPGNQRADGHTHLGQALHHGHQIGVLFQLRAGHGREPVALDHGPVWPSSSLPKNVEYE